MYALRNQVESRASSAKFGIALGVEPAAASEQRVDGELVEQHDDDGAARRRRPCAPASLAKATFETGEMKRKMNRKTSGAGERTLRNERSPSVRA